MHKRLARLDELLAEAQRLGRQGQGQGDPPWRSLDWSKTVIAGYELGAQTAMAVAGERQSDGSVLALKTVQPVAAIVISPQVFASPDAARYRDISIPVLGLTGPDDSDVLGLVRDVQWRQAPFAAMPAGRGWLLSANEVRHAALGGNEPRPEDTEREQKRIRAAEEQAQSQPQGRRGGGGRGGRGQEGPTRMAPVPAVPDYRQLHEQQPRHDGGPAGQRGFPGPATQTVGSGSRVAGRTCRHLAGRPRQPQTFTGRCSRASALKAERQVPGKSCPG